MAETTQPDPEAARTAIITGASSGLGYECARALLHTDRSWHVVLAVRDLERGRAVVCNAGVQVVSGERRSADGFELTFAVNHLGHFALVCGLLEQLAHPARIVVVSSDTHDPARRTAMPTPRYTSADELAMASSEPGEPPQTAGRRRYTTSKLCNLLFAYELDRRLDHGVTVNAFDPGLMPGSGLARDYPPLQ